ncbi:porin family protein [Mucilaginibacter sp. McL0603]|uniref:porin family protein n=1 Tax=Mucilaginibacter sp. McL0603 TaxID=3415670 RepID=UPI003CEA2A57
MKKILTTLLILSGIYSVSFAQTKNTAEFGVNIGLNTSNVSLSGSGQSTDYTSGFNAGISGEYYFSDRWGIKGKLTYDQKGWGNGFIDFYDNAGNVTGTIDGVNIHLNYLTIPVMADWHFGRMRNWYLNFGPYVGVLLNTSESSNSGVNIKDAFNTTDFGLAAGIGVKFPISKSVKLFIEADGQSGITNIFKDSGGETIQNVRSSLNFGVLFPIK